MSEPSKEIIRINQCANDCRKLLEGAGAEHVIIMASDKNHTAVIAPKDPPAVLSSVYRLLESLAEEDPLRKTVADYIGMLYNATMFMGAFPEHVRKSRWTDFTKSERDDEEASIDFMDMLRKKLDELKGENEDDKEE